MVWFGAASGRGRGESPGPLGSVVQLCSCAVVINNCVNRSPRNQEKKVMELKPVSLVAAGFSSSFSA